MHQRLAAPLVMLSLVACSQSHGGTMDATVGTDATVGVDAGGCGPCASPCCTRDPATGEPTAPFCPPEGLECVGPPPPLWCDDVCGLPAPGCSWVDVSEPCDCVTVACPGECDGLSEAACWAAPTCVALYDDACCPSCSEGPCADCIDPIYFGCAPASEACMPPSFCGVRPGCDGPVDCDGAFPSSDFGSCSVPGCAIAVESGCEGACEMTCRPVGGDSCTVACRMVEPPCPDGFTAEGDGECYTGFCIPAAVCGR